MELSPRMPVTGIKERYQRENITTNYANLEALIGLNYNDINYRNAVSTYEYSLWSMDKNHSATRPGPCQETK